MTGYVIFNVDTIHDQEKLNAYKKAAHPTISGYGGKVSIAYGRTRTLEGDPVVGMVMVEFPTYEDAEAWYESEGYQAAKALRKGAVVVRSVIVESMAPR